MPYASNSLRRECLSAMDAKLGKALFERCLPRLKDFIGASLPSSQDLGLAVAVDDVKVDRIASLWAGMGPSARVQA